ncbi:membrane protein [Pedobacter lusitanus]|uniref:Membrane protein n=1 Tax=Pedobacter lusitanus TaxID=1503925 RepID=A0A0D0GNC3_9SPHI|nr:RagB/SusD family nutrient uptake outer membrane protein [Pedobacter lusitanus]KIO78697.1 membrane protein [Pedobacter lusitanus]
MNIKIIFAGLFLAGAGFAGCSKNLNIEPGGDVSKEQIAQDPAALNKALNGIYLDLRSNGAGGTTVHSDFGLIGIRSGADLMSNDVIQAKNQHLGMFYNYDAGISNNIGTSIVWVTYYSRIFSINGLLAEISKIGVNKSNRSSYGQLLALRALSYYNLIRFYTFTYKGHENEPGIPLVLDNTSLETGLPRAATLAVYNQITADIEAAIVALDGYNRPSKAQIDQRTAKAIAADIYLEKGEYQKAADYARQARKDISLMTEPDYTGTGFSRIDNPELIWGFDNNTQTAAIGNYYASFFSMFDNTNQGYAGAAQIYKLIDKRLYEAIPATDYRKKVFNGATSSSYTFNGTTKNYPPYVNWKFKDPTLFEGDYIYIRSSSLYYIEAESLAKLGNESEAKQVLFDITSARNKAYQLSVNSGQDLLNEIYLQKRIELWGEGYAWFDMKRVGVPLERDYTGSNHTFGKFNLPVNSPKFRFQLPDKEINNNPQVIQNPL